MNNKKDAQMREGNISLILDSYDDIFSDFDPRQYSERSLSFDFLDECKRAARDQEEGVELRLLAPKHKRKIDDEQEIMKRLRNHFQKHFREEDREIKKMRREGLMWFFLGFVLMAAATFFYRREEFIFSLLFIVTEPAGWFMFWEGLVNVIITPKEKIPDYNFYKKMRNAQIVFLDY